jgi:hypothetical protein
MSNDTINLRKTINDEMVKCALDPVYFMKKYCFIQHPIKGKILFKLYPFQEKTLAEFAAHALNIVLKSRQMGISTLVAGYSLWLMLFHTDKNILVIATKQETAKNLVTKVREMHNGLPSWLKGKCVEDNRLSMRFSNGSQIKAESSSKDAARSLALSLLVIDEAAFVDEIDDIWTSAASTLSTGGRAIILSTPNGIGNFFHKKWIEAESGIVDQTGRGFNPISLKWDLHPERDQKWRDAQTNLLGVKEAGQECDCDFISSGNTVVPSEVIIDYSTKVSDPIEKRGIEQSFYIWKNADRSRDYVLSADVARGDGTDYSAFQLLDVESMEQVAEYKGKIDTKDFGDMLVNVATEYNNALLIVENSSIGWATIQQIIDRKYENLFYSNEDLQIVDTLKRINNKLGQQDKKMVPGFTNTSKSRPLIISKLATCMTEKTVILHSKRLTDELLTFIWENGKAVAAKNYNDDITMALAIALWVRDTALRIRVESLAATKSAINGFRRTTMESSAPLYSSTNHGMTKDPWSMRVGGQDESLTWLL